MRTNENIINLLSELKKFSGKTIAFFDIETKQLFKDIVPEWEDLTSSERKKHFPKITLVKADDIGLTNKLLFRAVTL